MQRTVSIITTSKSRLEHLKLSLPKMLGQPSAEVIVVDFSCPQGTGDYVRKHFPSIRVVSVEGEEGFSNWRARNAGASVATSDILVFCDADTLLADNAVTWIADNLPENAFGFFQWSATRRFNKKGLRLGNNQLKGFHAIPSAAFRRIGGYDEVLEGYAAGGDTDLEARLRLIRIAPFKLDPEIIEMVIEHDNSERTKHHAQPISISYCAGLLYRSAKAALIRTTDQVNVPLETRRELYEAAKTAARKLEPPNRTVGMTVNVKTEPILMPLQLGYEKATLTLSFKVQVSVENKLAEIPE